MNNLTAEQKATRKQQLQNRLTDVLINKSFFQPGSKGYALSTKTAASIRKEIKALG